MSTCQTCRWWLRNAGDTYLGVTQELGEALEVYSPMGDDTTVVPTYSVRRCTSPALRFYETPSVDGAAVCDGSEYWAGLFTGPQFGCSRHEPIS